MGSSLRPSNISNSYSYSFSPRGWPCDRIFYNSEENTYLVTNRHVLTREEQEDPESIRIFTRGNPDFAERSYHDIQLDDHSELAAFSDDEQEIDVVVIPLDFKLDSVNHRIGIYDERPPETGSLAYNTDSILSEKDRVLAGNKSEIVGYPGQYVDQQFDFPVTRSAVVSSQYGFPYNGLPIFLTDARMHPGTSGSPVLAGPLTLMNKGGIDLWGPAYKLLGVHSATLTQPMGDTSRLDLNTAWYAELIDGLIDSFE